MRARRITIEVLIVLAVTGLIAVILTWPLAANFDTIIAGGGSAGDNTGYLWDMWSNSRYGLDLWAGGLQTHVGVPFDRTIIGGANLLLFFYVGPAWALASMFPTIVAYNIITLTGLALAGGSMYLLIRWLGLGVGAASWAGLAFEIFPYELQRTAAFPPLGLIQFAPLLIMAAVFWLQRPSWRRALLLAAAVLFPWLSNPYFGAMALVALGVTLIVGAVVFARRTNWVTSAKRLGEAVGMFIVVVAIPLAAIVGSTKGVASAIATRQRIELELYGAHLGDYVKPLPGMYLMSGIFGSADNWPVVSAGGRTDRLPWLERHHSRRHRAGTRLEVAGTSGAACAHRRDLGHPPRRGDDHLQSGQPIPDLRAPGPHALEPDIRLLALFAGIRPLRALRHGRCACARSAGAVAAHARAFVHVAGMHPLHRHHHHRDGVATLAPGWYGRALHRE